jgi:hypothetical protein
MHILATIAFAFVLLGANTTLLAQEFQLVNLTQSLGLTFDSRISLNNQDVICDSGPYR